MSRPMLTTIVVALSLLSPFTFAGEPDHSEKLGIAAKYPGEQRQEQGRSRRSNLLMHPGGRLHAVDEQAGRGGWLASVRSAHGDRCMASVTVSR